MGYKMGYAEQLWGTGLSCRECWKGKQNSNKDGKRLSWYYSCCSMEEALKKKDELLEKYPQTAVRDNAVRKERIFRQDSPENGMGVEG